MYALIGASINLSFPFPFHFADNCGTVSNSSSNSSGAYNMDDILIITAKHSERAILRANFLKNHFDKITKQRGRKPFK